MSLPHTFFIGRGGGGGADLDIRVNARKDYTGSVSPNRQNAKGGTLTQYQNAATAYDGSALSAEGKAQIISRLGDGILHLKASKGNYQFAGRSSSGSGTQAGSFKEVSGLLTFSTDMDLLLLVPINGVGNYSGGGGLFLAYANDPDNITHTDMTSANAILVVGGGGGGYSTANTHNVPGTMTNSLSTAAVRRGPASPTYEEGAGFLNSYVVNYGSPNQPRHFVQGGAGTTYNGGCGGDMGGFGGGGGTCPGGGGGYVGGHGGTDTGGTYGGGGGTSYYKSSIITEIHQSTPYSINTTFTDINMANSGYFRIAPV